MPDPNAVERSRARKPGASPLHLLLVEDSDLDAALFQEFIRATDFIPSPVLSRARTIAEARSALRSESPDCVLLDLGLPDSAGLSGLAALRGVDTHAAIVMLTGHDDEATAMAALRTGAQDYLVKDQADGRTLGRAILRSIQRHELVAELAVQKRDADYEAHHDPLTGLANRRQFDLRLAEWCSDPTAPGWSLALLDLDGFKAINDGAGHAAGDEVLKETGQRLRLAIRAGDLVARLGGDEFVLLVAQGVPELADRLRAVIEPPIAVGSDTHRVSASIGIAQFPADARTPAALVAQADQRMYADKLSRRRP